MLTVTYSLFHTIMWHVVPSFSILYLDPLYFWIFCFILAVETMHTIEKRHPSIHPSSEPTQSLFGVTRLLKPTQLFKLGEGTLNRLPGCCRATHSHTHVDTCRDNRETPINLWRMFLTCRGKPECLEETHVCKGQTSHGKKQVGIWTKPFSLWGRSALLSCRWKGNQGFALKELFGPFLTLTTTQQE